MTNTSDPQESRGLAALVTLYRDVMTTPDAAALAGGLDAVLARIESAHRRRRIWIRRTIAVAALIVAGIVAVPFSSQLRQRWFPPELPMLTYQVVGGSVLEGGYLRESGGAGVSVQFNEGSNIALAPGARGRIREAERGEARIAIEHGVASFRITHGTGRRWLVDVGPFSVTVTGTAFTVAWAPLSDQFELRLERGRVTVNGPVLAGEITLRAGQRLTVDLDKAETLITDETAERTQQSASAPVAPPSAESPETATSPASDSPASPAINKLGGDHRWKDELARGHWDRILADAEHLGIESALRTASSEDLLALADAARYRRRLDLARSALLAERRRFPGSARALDAIYLLGRVEESRESGTAQAITWYDEYLARAQNGRFVGEALGRKMSLTERLQGSVSARPLAEEYLRRFPHGSYAGSARALIGVQ